MTVYVVFKGHRHDCSLPERAFTTARAAESWIETQPKHETIPGDDHYPRDIRARWLYHIVPMIVCDD